MYAYIKGKISEINPTNIVVDNNGIGYEIVVANPYEYQLEEENNIYKPTSTWRFKYSFMDFLRRNKRRYSYY